MLPVERVARIAVVASDLNGKRTFLLNILQFVDGQQGEYMADLVPVAVADEADFASVDESGGVVTRWMRTRSSGAVPSASKVAMDGNATTWASIRWTTAGSASGMACRNIPPAAVTRP